jgi:hypothetical protein
LRVLILPFLLTPPALAEEDGQGEEPPALGQPAYFNGAIGTFQVSASVEPATVQAEDPLIYTVRITAPAPPQRPPQRPHLAAFPAFGKNFYTEDVGPPAGDHPNPTTWAFRYRLKPKDVQVREVPAFPFVWYKPGVVPPRLGYQTAYVPAQPLTVLPREEVQNPASDLASLGAPELALELVMGDAVRQSWNVGQAPNPLVLILGLLVPPAACVGWYRAWRRHYPDAARLARRRRSRAARQAMKALRPAILPAGEIQVRHVARVVTRYLQDRLGLETEEPTPEEIADRLCRSGLDGHLVEQARGFFEACVAVRFGLFSSSQRAWAEEAKRLIQTLEAAI